MTLDLASDAEQALMAGLDPADFLPYVEQDLEDEPYVEGVFRSFAKVEDKVAPADTEDAAKFLHTEDLQNDDSWFRKCLSLQRHGRGLPAVYPTALSAAMATPKSERILNIKDLRRGMVAYSYDPRISGTAGHIFFVNGWTTKKDELLTTTNDAVAPGQVSVVPFSFYKEHWGHTFQFGATWLNGYDFSDFNKPPQPTKPGTLGERYEQAIEDLRKIEHQKRAKGFNKLADAIHRDIVRMERKLNRWS